MLTVLFVRDVVTPLGRAVSSHVKEKYSVKTVSAWSLGRFAKSVDSLSPQHTDKVSSTVETTSTLTVLVAAIVLSPSLVSWCIHRRMRTFHIVVVAMMSSFPNDALLVPILFQVK